MSKADNKELAGLHAALAKAFGSILTDGVTETNSDGEPVQVTAPAAYLNVIRQFLKDNDIKSDPDKDPNLKPLTANLPYPGGEDGDASGLPH